ncbi:hypothetical protein C4577_06330 [Candidatus Parcubacteria bacterium]|nr:MAG: hypothetical protein C4577_06330 [Candidatus Parcubacteria bacterium]
MVISHTPFMIPSTANAVILRGAKPVFAEIEENTLNNDGTYKSVQHIKIQYMEKKITPDKYE